MVGCAFLAVNLAKSVEISPRAFLSTPLIQGRKIMITHDFDDQAEIWTGTNVKRTNLKRLPRKANSPFFLMHHPENWELVVEDKKIHWLPLLHKLNEEAGVNGVQSTKAGPDSGLALARAQRDGNSIIPMELGYLTKYPAQNGHYFCIKFSKPKVIGNRIISKLDSKAYNEFRRMLIRDGFVKSMDEDLVGIYKTEQENKINRLYQDQHLPHIKDLIDKIQTDLKNADKAIIIKGK